MLKKRLLIALFVMMGTIISAQMAAAEYTVTTTGNGGYGPYQSGQGGEFSLVPNNNLKPYIGAYSANALSGVPTGAFQTFCLEENEYIYRNTEHSATISKAAIFGGVDGNSQLVPGVDPISVGTAYLYFQFATGNLPNYKYEETAANRKASAGGELQQAIWWLEGEQATLANSNIFKGYVLAQYTTEANAKQNLANEFPVRVLNLWKFGEAGNTNFPRQSQLVLVSSSVTDPPSPVPIPGALWLLGSGLAGLVCLRRRFAK